MGIVKANRIEFWLTPKQVSIILAALVTRRDTAADASDDKTHLESKRLINFINNWLPSSKSVELDDGIIRAQISKLRSEHPAFKNLMDNDATVHAWFKMAAAGKCTVDEAMIGSMVWAVNERDKALGELVTLKMKDKTNEQV
jgi:hypothetical protein